MVLSAVGKVSVGVRPGPLQRGDVGLLVRGGHLREGRGANALVEASLTDLGEGGALYAQAVRLRPLPL